MNVKLMQLIALLSILTVGIAITPCANGAIVFHTDFEEAFQSVTDAPVEHKGKVEHGFAVSAFTKGMGLGPLKIDYPDEALRENAFIGEPAGDNNATLKEAVDNHAYIEFTVNADAPTKFTRMDFGLRGHGSRLMGFATVRSSLDNFSNDLGTAIGPLNRVTQHSINLTQFKGFDSARQITFRFYLYDDYTGQNNRRIGIDFVTLHADVGLPRSASAEAPSTSLVSSLSQVGAMLESSFQVHGIFTDNMVFQRDQPIQIFGTGVAGTHVEVSLGDDATTASVDNNGYWQVSLPPRPASFTPLKLKVSTASESIALSNILIGDVWLGSGQSNMARPIRANGAVPVADDCRHHPNLRFATIAIRPSQKPLNDTVIEGSFDHSWQIASGEVVDDLSALGFYFGTHLQRELEVPIGIIISARGSTRIESWCAIKTLQRVGIDAGNSTSVNHNTPSALYNAMIHPLRKFPIRGVIWYQGEANANQGNPAEYRLVFKEMISAWRSLFNQPEMPFLFVQLAPFRANPANDNWALLREAQAAALKLPNTGMAVITDAGEFRDIHPQDKKTPGSRLALLALEMSGIDVASRSPLFAHVHFRPDSRGEVYFYHAESGLQTRRVVMNRQPGFAPGKDPQAFVVEGDALHGFEIRAEAGEWQLASATIISPGGGLPDFVEVWSEAVSAPVAVRYGWANFPLSNLYNGAGLPASPFRSDRAAISIDLPNRS